MIKLLLLLTALALAADDNGMVGPPADPPRSEVATAEMTKAIASLVRCPVCQGLSVNDSKADAAVAMKNRIEELVAEGYSEEQITDYFTERYGDWILLEPRRQGVNWLVWLGPVIFLGVGAGWIGWSLKSREGDAPGERPPTDGSIEATEANEDIYTQRILDELGEGQ